MLPLHHMGMFKWLWEPESDRRNRVYEARLGTNTLPTILNLFSFLTFYIYIILRIYEKIKFYFFLFPIGNDICTFGTYAASWLYKTKRLRKVDFFFTFHIYIISEIRKKVKFYLCVPSDKAREPLGSSFSFLYIYYIGILGRFQILKPRGFF